MKVFSLAMIAAASAIQLDQESGYNLYWEVADLHKPDIWDVVKRGGVKGFADMNVEKAMKRNPSSGEWPIAQVEPIYDLPEKVVKPHWTKQPWEYVVKKGNSGFNDKQVNKALAKIPEPIVLDGKVTAGGNPPADHSW